MSTHYTYALLLISSISFPFLASFHPRIKFYKEWKYHFGISLAVALFFIVWDEWFTDKGIWWFNSNYILGSKLGHLPLEEISFFLIIPYCLLFIYHCLPVQLGKSNWGLPLAKVVGTVLLLLGLLFHDKWYPGLTFSLTGIVLLISSFVPIIALQLNWERIWVGYWIGLIPFFIVNGFLTALPVVCYNNAENLGLRMYTIPVEDSIYNLLLFFLNVMGYQLLKNRALVS